MTARRIIQFSQCRPLYANDRPNNQRMLQWHWLTRRACVRKRGGVVIACMGTSFSAWHSCHQYLFGKLKKDEKERYPSTVPWEIVIRSQTQVGI